MKKSIIIGENKLYFFFFFLNLQLRINEIPEKNSTQSKVTGAARVV